MQTNALMTLKRIWPEWQVEAEPIGAGTYGTVYKAVRGEVCAAIKVIPVPPHMGEVDSLRSEGLDMDQTRTYLQCVLQDFIREIRIMETLKDRKNIVSIEDYRVVEREGLVGWDIFIRMELLTPFAAYICDKKLYERDVTYLGMELCSALETCAEHNIIHRDVKPENIFVDSAGEYKLGDFGIARRLESLNMSLSPKGAPNYMAPEVVKCPHYDTRADIYSLGLVLYRLLNDNRLPFLDTEKQILSPDERKRALDRRMRGEALPPPVHASPLVAQVILRACAYDPDQRFASAADMDHALLVASLQSLTRKSVSEELPADSPNPPGEPGSASNGPEASGAGPRPEVARFGEEPKRRSWIWKAIGGRGRNRSEKEDEA